MMSKKASRQLNIIAAILALLVVSFALVSPLVSRSVETYLNRQLLSNGYEARAVVVEKELSKNGRLVTREGENDYRVRLTPKMWRLGYGKVRYQFRDHENRLRSGVEAVNRELYERYETGDEIRILYFKRFPFLNKIKESATAVNRRLR